MAEVIPASDRRDGEGVAAVTKSKKLLSDLPMELQRAILRHVSFPVRPAILQSWLRHHPRLETQHHANSYSPDSALQAT